MNDKTKKICITALLAAMCYIGFQFLRIDIPVGEGGKTAIHFGNAFCVLASLLLGGVWGGSAGAIGMGIADVTGGYITSAPMTIVLKFLMGLFSGFAFRFLKKFNIKPMVSTVLSSAFAMALNIVADPLLRYFYNRIIYGTTVEIASLLAKISSVTTAVNAISTVIVVFFLYPPISKILNKIK